MLHWANIRLSVPDCMQEVLETSGQHKAATSAGDILTA